MSYTPANAEEEAYMKEVEACRFSEVRSHLSHHADLERWLFGYFCRSISKNGPIVIYLTFECGGGL